MSELAKPLPDLEQIVEIRDPAVNVDDVMAQIRATLAAHGPLMPPDVPPLGAQSDDGALAFHLTQANLTYDQVFVEMNVMRPNVPLLGGWLARLKARAHELAVYYVNQHAGLQVNFNSSLVRVLSLLAARDAEVRALRADLERLRARLDELERRA
ncbi:MAG: hypothetical protein HZB53_12460 [Chloroflexi bacterium]|nr:hypothetical protein [Chloroflexota bacterium]